MAVRSATADSSVALADIQDLATLLSTAFGPNGRAVLLQCPTGQMTVTRSGCNILKSVCSEVDAPHRKILTNCAENVQGTFGDGVKSFVFITSGMLRSVTDLNSASRVARQLSILQAQLAQINFLSNDEPFVKCRNYQIITTFFNTRFPSPVSSVLGPLIHEFISKYCCICSAMQVGDASLEDLYTNFAVLCRYQGSQARSVSESHVKNSFTLSRRACSRFRPGPRKLVVFAFEDVLSEDGKFDDLDVKCEIEHFLMDLQRNVDTSDDTLLVTSVILSDLTLYNLRRKNVVVVHGAPVDEVSYLSSISSNIPGPVIVGVENITDNVSLQVPSVQQLIIHGPSKELREEYAGTCRSVIKLLTELSKPTMGSVLVQGGGHFEQTLCHHLSRKLEKNKNYLPKLESRAQLLKWHEQKLNGNSDKREIVPYQRIAESFAGIHSDVISSVVEGLLEIPKRIGQISKPSEVFEPLALKLGVLHHAISAIIILIRIDQVLGSNNKKSVQMR